MSLADDIAPTLTELAGLPVNPLPASMYYDPEHFDLERERVFRRSWLMMGRVESIPNPGDFFVKEVEVLPASILVTRQKNGSIRAFHNVCSHRGNIVALEKSGTASKFSCRYHSWTYRNDGDLLAVPDEQRFFGLDKKKCGLTPISIDIWEGWIFACLASSPEVSLREFLGDMGTSFSNVVYPDPEQALVIEGTFSANWKTVADAFSEAYHIQAIHPKTLAPSCASKKNPFSAPISAQIHGSHRSLSTWGNLEYVPLSKAKVERWIYPGSQTILGIHAGEDNPRLAHPHINPTKSEEWGNDVKWIFPNFHVQMSANKFWTHQFWPLTPTTARWEGRFYMPKAKTARERVQQEHYTAQITDVMLEDLSNIESTQRGMNTGGKSFVHFQDGEILLRHALLQVQKWVQSVTVRDALSDG